MPNSIGVIDQLAPSTSTPKLFIKRKEAIFLIATNQVVWVEQERLVRKTPKYQRLTADKVIHKEAPMTIPWVPKQSGKRGPTVMQMVTS
jgi:hypothetical protein